MELRQLQIFRVLATELNFTRTAEIVHCVQSNVTVQIRSLETELGVMLFERTGKRVRLTEHGRRLLPYAERVLGLVSEASEALRVEDEPRGLVTIGVPESVLTYRLPPMLQALRSKYPHVELSFQAKSSSQLWTQLDRGSVDLLFAIDDKRHFPQFEIEVLGPEPMALLVHPEHRLSHARWVRPSDLTAETLLVTEEDCSYRRKLEAALVQAGIGRPKVMSFSGVEAIKHCTMLGIGVAHLPRMVAASELASRRLCELNWRGPSLKMHTMVAWHKDKWHSPAMKAFLEMVNLHCRPQSSTGADSRGGARLTFITSS